MEHMLPGALAYGWENGMFWVRGIPTTREPGTWRAELIAAALMIANTAQRPLWIAMSGGAHAEIMATAFFDQGINFSALTLEHVEGTNRADVERAKAWCFRHGIPHKIIPLPAERFLTHDLDEYIQAGYVATSAHRYLQLRLLEVIDDLGGYAVLGNGKHDFHYRLGCSVAVLRFGEPYSVPIEWSKRKGNAHQPYFMMCTPEIILAYLRIPMVANALQTPQAFKNEKNNNPLRRFVYQTEWPEVSSRPHFHGFEKMPDLLFKARLKLKESFENAIQSVELPADIFMAQLEGSNQTKSFAEPMDFNNLSSQRGNVPQNRSRS